ncbi:hypothetical protein EBZ80_26865 [bacterium]|nr:hypothetical protein [bacterium]
MIKARHASRGLAIIGWPFALGLRVLPVPAFALCKPNTLRGTKARVTGEHHWRTGDALGHLVARLSHERE